MPMPDTFQSLGIALAIGLLVGVERGWTQRGSAEGTRVAGLRTFGLIGLLGGIIALLSADYGGWLLAVGFLSVAVLVALGHWVAMRGVPDLGVTTEVAALLTYALGALAVSGKPALAVAGAVVVALLLGMKGYLHGLLQRLEKYELTAGLQLALITLVVLPVLPNQGYGPWQVLNPYKLWLMVVLISAISFAGHFAVRIAGPRRGLLITGLFAGLASSTALTLSFSRMGKQRRDLQSLLAAGVVVAGVTMFPRMLVVVAVVNPRLVGPMLIPFGVLTAIGIVGALWLWRRDAGLDTGPVQAPSGRPFELRTSLQFAALLAAILFLAEAGRRYLGAAGIYGVSLLSGLTDVDAITLSLSDMAPADLHQTVAVHGMLVAALANTVVKGGMVAVICGGPMARAVARVFAAIVVCGLAFLFVPGIW